VYFVRVDGDDANSGMTNTPEGAWRTIQHAADTLVAGDTVKVQPGTYIEDVTPTNSGTRGNPITYLAEGAVIWDGNQTGVIAFFADTKSDIVIDGFEVTGFPDASGNHATMMFCDCDRITIRNCIMHDTGRDALNFGGRLSSTCNGGDGALVENNIFYNLLDDGITFAQGTDHTVRNNTFFNCLGRDMESARLQGPS